MRWIKHMTDTSMDPKIVQMVSVYGLHGYGMWWRLLEIVAAQVVGDQATCSYPVAHWVATWRTRRQHAASYVQLLHDLKLIDLAKVNNNGTEFWTIKVDNLLKYRDEYSKAKNLKPKKVSAHSADKLPTMSAPRTEGELDTEGEGELNAEAPPKSTPPPPASPPVPQGQGQTRGERTAQFFAEKYKAKYGAAMTPKPRDADQAEQLLAPGDDTEEDLAELIGIFFTWNGDHGFLGTLPKTWDIFYKHINEIRAKALERTR